MTSTAMESISRRALRVWPKRAKYSISDAVFQQVKGVDDLCFVSLGDQALKNIPEPVLVYRVTEGEQKEAIDIRYLLSKPAVAVLPFTNMSGDPEQEYFSDGLSEDLITALSYWKSFPVIARNSSFVYKGRHVDVRQVSKELGARYVLEGSVRKSGERLRVSAQLLDAETGYHVWSERMDRQLEDIFAIQDEITLRIASIVEPAIQMAEAHRGQAVKTKSLSAWDLYQKGNFHFYQFTPEASDLARDFYQKSAGIDPLYASAFVGIAQSWYVRIMLGRAEDHEAAISAAMAAARKAVALDETDSHAHLVLGLAHMWSKAHGNAVAEGLRAVQCNPSHSLAHIIYGNILDVAGRPEEGLTELEAGIRLNPLNPMMHQSITWLAGACLNARRYSEAIEWVENALLRDLGYPLTHLFRAVTLAHLGDAKKAAAALEDCEIAGPGFVERFVAWRAYQRPEDNQHMLSGLRKAGWDH